MRCLILAFLCTLLSVSASADPTKDVNVVNTPDVNVTNTPDVFVVGTPGVTVENQESSPIPVIEQMDESNLAFFQGPVFPAGNEILEFPSGFKLLVTDIIIQNLSAGHEPVAETEFSRVEIYSGASGSSSPVMYITVVGNQMVDLQFKTGVVYEAGIWGSFVRNVGNSTAPFIRYTILGRFIPAP